jgi:hypothetical protein
MKKGLFKNNYLSVLWVSIAERRFFWAAQKAYMKKKYTCYDDGDGNGPDRSTDPGYPKNYSLHTLPFSKSGYNKYTHKVEKCVKSIMAI